MFMKFLGGGRRSYKNTGLDFWTYLYPDYRSRVFFSSGGVGGGLNSLSAF